MNLKNEVNENLENKTKVIHNNTSVVDNNIIEAPLFVGSSKYVRTIGELEEEEHVGNNVKRILNALKKNYKKVNREKECVNIPVVHRNWLDKQNKCREMLILGDIPTLSTMDAWNGLVALYIKKTAPLIFDDTKQAYDIEDDTMYFTLYELAKVMNKSTSGNVLNKLMEEILTLKNATYYSLEEGMFYVKKKNNYLKSKIDGFSLILDAKFESEKRIKDRKVTTKCYVQFNRMIIENIKYEYIKYLNPNEYFSLPSRGYTRRLYLYIKGNMHKNKKEVYPYIKRSIDVLCNKLPIDYNYISEFKRKLKKPLENLLKIGIIKDYFYGDEVLINGINEKCLYLIFKGAREDVIKKLSSRKKITVKEKLENDNEFKLYIPENIKAKLKSIGLSSDYIGKITKQKSKWEIIKYILWIEEEITKRKIANPAGLLRYALTSESVELRLTHKHIVDFVERKKNEKRINRENIEFVIKKDYDDYVSKAINKFKREDKGTYELMVDNFLAILSNISDNKIKELNLLLLSGSLKEDEKEKLQNMKKDWMDFENNQKNSKLFKEKLKKEISEYLLLKNFQDFKKDYKATL